MSGRFSRTRSIVLPACRSPDYLRSFPRIFGRPTIFYPCTVEALMVEQLESPSSTRMETQPYRRIYQGSTVLRVFHPRQCTSTIPTGFLVERILTGRWRLPSMLNGRTPWLQEPRLIWWWVSTPALEVSTTQYSTLQTHCLAMRCSR